MHLVVAYLGETKKASAVGGAVAPGDSAARPGGRREKELEREDSRGVCMEMS